MPASSKAEPLAEQARFVFKGTVQKLKAVTMPAIPVSDRTAVVRVDEVFYAPEDLSHYTGQDITVQLGGRKKVKKGQQAVFYTNGWLFGESVAVQSVDHREVGKSPAAFTQAGGDPIENLANKDLRARVANADLIVSGKVTSVRLPTDAAALAAGSTPSGFISEHDPDWRIAEVQFHDVHKGSHAGKTATVRFASSNDVMWHDAPKFHPGQEGFFTLHKDEATAAASVRAALGADTGDYVALHPTDFQPFDQQGGVRNMITPSAEPDSSSGADEH